MLLLFVMTSIKLIVNYWIGFERCSLVQMACKGSGLIMEVGIWIMVLICGISVTLAKVWLHEVTLVGHIVLAFTFWSLRGVKLVVIHLILSKIKSELLFPRFFILRPSQKLRKVHT